MSKLAFYAQMDPKSGVAPSVSDGRLDDPTEALEAFQETAAKIDHLQTIQTTLESYKSILEDTVSNGGASDGVVIAIKTALESFPVDSEELMLQNTLPSMESFGQTNSRRGATVVSVEAIGERVKAAGQAVMKAIERLFQMLMDMFSSLTNGLGRAEKRLTKLKAQVKELKGGAAGKQIEITGHKNLTANGKFVGLDSGAIGNIEVVAKDMWGGYINNFRTAVNGDLKPKDWVAAHQFALRKYSSSTTRIYSIDDRELPSQVRSKINSLSTVKVSNILPGDYALLEFDFKVESLRNSGWAVKAMFTKMEIGRGSNDPTLVNVPTVREIESTIDALLKITALKREQESASKAVREIRDKLKKAADNGVDEHSRTLLLWLSRSVSTPSGNFTAYVSRTLNAYGDLLSQFIKEHVAAGATTTQSDSTSSVPA